MHMLHVSISIQEVITWFLVIRLYLSKNSTLKRCLTGQKKKKIKESNQNNPIIMLRKEPCHESPWKFGLLILSNFI